VFWDYVVGVPDGAGRVVFDSILVAPPDASMLTVRLTLRWVATGAVEWRDIRVEDLGPVPDRGGVRVAVATGTEARAREARPTLEQGVAFYADLAEKACAEYGARLVALPEIGPQWHLPGTAFDKAVPVPGPETDRFAQIARRYDAVIVVGIEERDGDAVFNSAVTIDATGEIAGVYHKVHLASFEAFSGVCPGTDFPVHDTRVGRIGCNICMDSSATESSRMVGLNGADFLVLPIMGDHRASVWQRGNPVLDEDRWRCIMRTRAMDNQLTLVVARNCGVGSCIIDRSGGILACNDGTADVVAADVPWDDAFRKWNGGCFRQVNWRQRRPNVYGAFVDAMPAALRRLPRYPSSV
jgi:predicted amidohydrolase